MTDHADGSLAVLFVFALVLVVEFLADGFDGLFFIFFIELGFVGEVDTVGAVAGDFDGAKVPVVRIIFIINN